MHLAGDAGHRKKSRHFAARPKARYLTGMAEIFHDD
jgi:hypothetical protein